MIETFIFAMMIGVAAIALAWLFATRLESMVHEFISGVCALVATLCIPVALVSLIGATVQFLVGG